MDASVKTHPYRYRSTPLTSKNVDDAVVWCQENIARHVPLPMDINAKGYIWSLELTSMFEFQFHFRYKEDYFKFMLTWG